MSNEQSKVISFGYNEILKVIREIKSQDLLFNSEQIEYFFDAAKDYMFHEKVNDVKRVGILGLNIPEELIIACGAKPIWILGGSLDFANYSDSVVQSETDPVVKSLLGMLLSKQFPSFMDIDLLVIPIFSDSMQKASDILSKHYDVLEINVPQDKDGEYSNLIWRRQLKKMVRKICSLTGVKLTKVNLIQETNIVIEAKLQIKRLINNYKKSNNLISSNLYILILNSYFMTANLEEWSARLALLNDDIENFSISELKKSTIEEPNIVLIGSSIFFPNMKIPTLFEKSGLNIFHIESEMLAYLSTIPYIENIKFKGKIFESITDSYFESCVYHFSNNTTTMESLKNSLLHSKIDGVLYHVLRGQEISGFEFEGIKNFSIKKGIKVLNLETDYSEEDIERLALCIQDFKKSIC